MHKIISSAQKGADRAELDAAIEPGIFRKNAWPKNYKRMRLSGSQLNRLAGYTN